MCPMTGWTRCSKHRRMTRRFQPTLLNKAPVRTFVSTTIRFKLYDSRYAINGPVNVRLPEALGMPGFLCGVKVRSLGSMSGENV